MYAEQMDRPASVSPGLNTNEIKGKEHRTSFWGTPPKILRKTLAELRQELSGNPAVRCIMLHHYGSLVEYLERTCGKPVGKIEGYASQIVVDEAISWLEEKRDPDAPFFLNIWFHEPHAPIAAPEEIVSQYGKLKDPAAIYSGTIDNTGGKGSNFEGGIRVPGIFCWPGTITKGHVQHDPSGMVDLLPTVCGLLGIDKPEGVHLDGSDLSPLLTSRDNEFARHQPLFWLLPASYPAAAIWDGNYSMVAYRDYELPKDKEAMAGVLKQIEEILRKANSEELGGGNLRNQVFNSKFTNKEAERLRVQYVRLNMFQESWIPSIKSGSYERLELFDLAKDPQQKNDLSAQLPDVVARLKKKLLDINASVMAGAHDWHLK